MTERSRSSAADDALGDAPPPPPRALLSGLMWREIAYLLANFPLGVAAFVVVLVWLTLGIGLSITVVGLPLLATGLLACRQYGRLERARAAALLGVRIAEPSRLRPRERGFFPWLWTCLKDPVAWRHALFAFVRLPWVLLTFTVVLVLLVVGWPVLPWVARWLSNVDRAMVRGLLSPSDELERRIAELESDRVTVTDTAAADLRRIERDLHDGAQARLVALAMGLGLAKEKLLEDPEAAAAMVDEAHGEVKLALQELRDLARGIHPAILTDRGLGPALASLAGRCTVPVTTSVDLDERPAPAIEGIAYFTVSELLQNVSKHSAARQASVEVWRAADRLLILVSDDGRGGARLDGGSGMAGLAGRLGSVDGLFVLDSPVGGPTRVTAELPWRARTEPAAASRGR
ncbi:signal transduction histidine kinase [Streptomyces sp. 2333.5]|uniref:sensor histidine kinase n=1 Tax=unclassified Streptomyces TaxID=2593676 RepID=UPI00089AA4B2|nr:MULTISPECIES: sensor histidine kinase [unclassified Streptomyces]PJJ02751.1 signal transduction histidine kinase [Streptomyces sp. 2333.5]SED25090.1 Signal transduction histidine kinase [Streptomyces sp. 2314.4]SEE12944.1 Signal transduction histidine kinase [Streptomyces sp. 2112.2]